MANGLFHGLVIAACGVWTEQLTPDCLGSCVEINGGRWSKIINSPHVTHLVASREHWLRQSREVAAARDFPNIHIVSWSWIVDCLRLHRRLDESPYLWYMTNPAALMNTTVAAPMNMAVSPNNHSGCHPTGSLARDTNVASRQAEVARQMQARIYASQQLAIQNQLLHVANNGVPSCGNPHSASPQEARQNQRPAVVNQNQHLPAAYHDDQVRANPHFAAYQGSGQNQRLLMVNHNQNPPALYHNDLARATPHLAASQEVRQNQCLAPVNQRQQLPATYYNDSMGGNLHFAAGQGVRQDQRLSAVHQRQHLPTANYNAPATVNAHLAADQEARQNQRQSTANHCQNFQTVSGSAQSTPSPRFEAQQAPIQSQYGILPGVQRTVSFSNGVQRNASFSNGVQRNASIDPGIQRVSSRSPSITRRRNTPGNNAAQDNVNPHLAAWQTANQRFPTIIDLTDNNDGSQSVNPLLLMNHYGGQNQASPGVNDYVQGIHFSVPPGHPLASRNQLSSDASNMAAPVQAAALFRNASTMHAEDFASVNNMTSVRTGTPVNRMTPVKARTPVKAGTPVNNTSPVNNMSPVRTGIPGNNMSPVRTSTPVNNMSLFRAGTPVNNMSLFRAGTPVNNMSPVRTGTPVNSMSPVNDAILISSDTSGNTTPASTITPVSDGIPRRNMTPVANIAEVQHALPTTKVTLNGDRPCVESELARALAPEIQELDQKRRVENLKTREKYLEYIQKLRANGVKDAMKQATRHFNFGKEDARKDLGSEVYHSYVDTTGFIYHDVTLTRVDVTKNTNETIRLSIYETDFFPSNYTTHISITHVNRTIETEVLANGTDYYTAYRAFRKAFKQYTRISWEQRLIDPAIVTNFVNSIEEQKRKAMVFDKVGEQPESGRRTPSPPPGAKQTPSHKRKDSCHDDVAEEADRQRPKKRQRRRPMTAEQVLTKEELESCKIDPVPFRYVAPPEGKPRGDFPDERLMGKDPVMGGDEPTDGCWWFEKWVP